MMEEIVVEKSFNNDAIKANYLLLQKMRIFVKNIQE